MRMPRKKSAIAQIEEFKGKAMSVAAREAFDILTEDWPFYTGWSAANNRIKIGRGPHQYELIPPEKPEEIPGVLGFEAEFNRQDQMHRAQFEVRKVNPDFVYIGNAVPYARDVGFDADGNPKIGNGVEIYKKVAAKTPARIKRYFRS